MRTKIIYSIALSLLLLFTFCAEEDECPDTNIPNLVIEFQQSEAESIDTIFVFCKGLPDSLYTGNSNPNNLSVPLKLSSDTTPLTFQLRHADTLALLTDRIFFIHNKEIYTKNLECGFQTRFYLRNIQFSSNIIDSIYILDTVINSDESIHAKIFY